jgi:hypothetical protein
MLPMTIPRPRQQARPRPERPGSGEYASKPERPGAEGAKSGKRADARGIEVGVFAGYRSDR